jgi:hypothetical protein
MAFNSENDCEKVNINKILEYPDLFYNNLGIILTKKENIIDYIKELKDIMQIHENLEIE